LCNSLEANPLIEILGDPLGAGRRPQPAVHAPTRDWAALADAEDEWLDWAIKEPELPTLHAILAVS
jgi:hypothetical protein